MSAISSKDKSFVLTRSSINRKPSSFSILFRFVRLRISSTSGSASRALVKSHKSLIAFFWKRFCPSVPNATKIRSVLPNSSFTSSHTTLVLTDLGIIFIISSSMTKCCSPKPMINVMIRALASVRLGWWMD